MKNFLEKLLFGGGVVFDLFKWLIMAIVVITLVGKFLFSVFFVDGESMAPNLETKELVTLNIAAYYAHNPARGDVVVVKYPGDPTQKKYVKRVVGLPGEKITIKGGRVYIDDKLLQEEYLDYGVSTVPNKDVSLTDKQFYLMGDNRPGSNDSRFFGPVEKRFITGRATVVLFPRLRQIPKADY